MKSYLNLKEEVWDKNICSGCGACVAVCPVENIYFKQQSPVKFECELCACTIDPTAESECPASAEFCKVTLYDVPCGACYDACPRTEEKVIPPVEEIGKYIEIFGAKSKMDIKYAQSGGAVTAILCNALDEGLIDGAIVVSEDKWTMEPKSVLATTKEELIKAAGSRYNWNVPILEALKEAVMVKKLEKLAIVGTPCVINAVFQILASDNDLLKPFKKAIRLKIGLFCTETFKYGELMAKIKSMGINPWEIKKIEIRKGKLAIDLLNGETKELPLKDVEPYVRKGCSVCRDLTALVSDISAGNVGTPEGVTTLIVRNEWGKGFVERAILNGYLEKVDCEVNIDAIKKLAKKKMERGD
jgi:coenzyme F420 hydrogenase subunit beta